MGRERVVDLKRVYSAFPGKTVNTAKAKARVNLTKANVNLTKGSLHGYYGRKILIQTAEKSRYLEEESKGRRDRILCRDDSFSRDCADGSARQLNVGDGWLTSNQNLEITMDKVHIDNINIDDGVDRDGCIIEDKAESNKTTSRLLTRPALVVADIDIVPVDHC